MAKYQVTLISGNQAESFTVEGEDALKQAFDTTIQKLVEKGYKTSWKSMKNALPFAASLMSSETFRCARLKVHEV